MTAPAAAAVDRFRGDLAELCDIAADRVLVAVSGGADSLALLLLSHAVLGDRCHAATVDHGLRPEAAAEAAFVADVCRVRGIGHATLAGALPARVGRTANLSSRARALRYALLETQAAAIGARWIATAHHADDQLETLVMRLNRGAGVAGLAGIRAKGARVIRPLLGWRRAELAALVADAGIVPVDDPSNRDDRFDRARLRKRLAGVDWIDTARWCLSARALRDAEDAIDWAARGARAAHCSFGDGEAVLSPGDLPLEIRRRLLEHCIRHVVPGVEPRGSDLAAVLRRLDGGERTTLADVLCRPADTPGGIVWRFTAAPPRRSL